MNTFVVKSTRPRGKPWFEQHCPYLHGGTSKVCRGKDGLHISGSEFLNFFKDYVGIFPLSPVYYETPNMNAIFFFTSVFSTLEFPPLPRYPPCCPLQVNVVTICHGLADPDAWGPTGPPANEFIFCYPPPNKIIRRQIWVKVWFAIESARGVRCLVLRGAFGTEGQSGNAQNRGDT